MLDKIIAGLAPQLAPVIAGQLGSLLPGLMPTVTNVIDRLIPDPAAAAQAKLEIAQAVAAKETALTEQITALAKGQNEINLADAQSGSLFKAGWRPAVGWICAAGSAYGFVVQPFFVWLNAVVNAMAGSAIPAPPTLDMATLMTLLFGLLGLGGLRTFEKNQGVAAR